jgi:dTDP-4-amino-4,6-dideoxygalactose transaminase
LIEDAAQAHGATYNDKRVGTFGALGAFSFYPGKNLGACGEGGALVTNGAGLAERARSLRDHGSSRRYYHDEIGFNYRMEGIQGAVLDVKLRYLDDWTAQRRRVAQSYTQLLSGTGLKLPCEAKYAKSAWHLYVIRHLRRDELKKHLDANNIGCGMHYPVPLHLQKAFKYLGYKEGAFPVAEQAAKQCLSLPIYPELTEEQIRHVTIIIKAFG